MSKKIVSIRELTNQDILELDALHLCNAMFGQNHTDWSKLSPAAKENWVRVAAAARELRGGNREHAAEVKIAALRELHRPVPIYTTEMGDCEHGDDCEGVEISDGVYCPVHTDGLTCEACAETGEHMDGLPAYPCQTIAALDVTP